MKTNIFPKSLAIVAIAGLTALGFSAGAQQTAATPAVPPTVSSPAPQMSYGVSQILQLNQAKVGDDTIVAYVRNSGNSYGLDANQIIFLRQQGVSEGVITAMLNQPKAGVASAPEPVLTTSSPAPDQMQTATSAGSTATYDSSAYVQPTATVAPTVTYVQTVPTYYDSSPYYYYPYSYPYYYGYGYGWYPGVSIGFGYGYRGGWGGGWRGGGGGFHGGGGGFHGGGGGGFHGGGGHR